MQTKQPFAHRLRAAGGNGERDVGRDAADIGRVVIEPFELEELFDTLADVLKRAAGERRSVAS